MDTEKRKVLISVSICFCCCLFLAACAGDVKASPTPIPLPSITVELATDTATSTPLPLVQAQTSTPTCVSGLSFINDITIPDNSTIAPGNTIDKQWLIQNSGTCNWDDRYRLRLISGDPLGVTSEQALYPARASMQATVRIIFTAPTVPGDYVSEWQAFDPNGIPFGDSFFIKISVQQ